MIALFSLILIIICVNKRDALNNFHQIVGNNECRVMASEIANVDAVNQYLFYSLQHTSCYGLNMSIEFEKKTIMDKFLKSPDYFAILVSLIEIHRVQGFYLSPEYETSLISFNSFVFYRFYLDFYDKNSQLIVKKPNDDDKYSLCDNYLRAFYDIDTIENNSGNDDIDSKSKWMINEYKGFLADARFRYLTFSLGSSYRNELCPIVFKSSAIEYLQIYGLFDSWISRNVLRFSQMEGVYFKNTKFKDIQANILKVLFSNTYNLLIDKFILNEQVFRNVEQLILHGHFRTIEKNVFRSFRFFRVLILESTNFREFLHNSNNEWLTSFKNNSSNKEMKIYIYLNEQDYMFPDEDFCLFKH